MSNEFTFIVFRSDNTTETHSASSFIIVDGVAVFIDNDGKNLSAACGFDTILRKDMMDDETLSEWGLIEQPSSPEPITDEKGYTIIDNKPLTKGPVPVFLKFEDGSIKCGWWKHGMFMVDGWFVDYPPKKKVVRWKMRYE